MKFSELLNGAETVAVSGGSVDVSGLQYDSRKVGAGDCFVAMEGGSTDGNLYIDASISQGAVAVVSDSPEQKRRGDIAWASIRRSHGRRVLGQMSANLFGEPAKKLKLVGVTGTNGKTTTTYLIESMLA